MDLNIEEVIGLDIKNILSVAIKGKASDIHLKSGLPPIFRVNGNLIPLKDAPKLTPEIMSNIAFGMMNNKQRDRFQEHNELDLAYGITGMGRFRVNVFQQRGMIGMVLRVIPTEVKGFDDLYLPPVLKNIALESRGLIVVTGATGSGKSTTLASMVDFINSNRTCHILTIEDPIEYLMKDKRSVINQRELSVDTNSFSSALRSALRQDPDVIMVGEMRDLETIEMALVAGETGHLVLSTLHASDCTETISRVISVFPPHQHQHVRYQLASILKSIVSQRLLPTADGKGRVPAIEILIQTARVKELISDEKRTLELIDAMRTGHSNYGMQTFDQSLMQLVQRNLVRYEEALRHCTNRGDFELKMKGISGGSSGDADFSSEAEKAKPTGGMDIERF